LDFVSDTLTDGRRFRILTVVDDFTRECLCLVADTSLSGAPVARELDADSDAKRPAIPIHSGHLFRSIPAGHSD
jgi:transposase InsO family protein